RVGPRDARDLLSVIDQDECRDAANAKPTGQVRRVITVDLDQLQLAGQIRRNLFDGWRHDPAGGAPGRPEIHEHRQCALFDHGRILGLAAFGQPGQRVAAVTAVRDAARRGWDAIRLAAVWAADQSRLFRRSVHRLVTLTVRTSSRGAAVTNTAAAPSYLAS